MLTASGEVFARQEKPKVAINLQNVPAGIPRKPEGSGSSGQDH